MRLLVQITKLLKFSFTILPMSKPISYYTNYIPGDDSYLTSIEKRYGSQLEHIGLREKIYLLKHIATDLGDRAYGAVRPEMHTLAYEIIRRLEPSEREGLMEALVVQIRWDKHV